MTDLSRRGRVLRERVTGTPRLSAADDCASATRFRSADADQH
jgi:hypothetical protein